jgi:hypothetical protein
MDNDKIVLLQRKYVIVRKALAVFMLRRVILLKRTIAKVRKNSAPKQT